MTDWGEFELTRLNLVSWPAGKIVGGQLQTSWELRTLEDIPADRLHLLDRSHLDSLAQDMSFDIEDVGRRDLTMRCTCDESLPYPDRIGAASVAWHHIDQEVARLWMIGDSPRAWYPEFMRQRRRLLERVAPGLRRLWLAFVVARAEPCAARIAGREFRGEEIFGELEPGSFADRVAALLAGSHDSSVGDDAPLGSEFDVVRVSFRSAMRMAMRGLGTDSVDLTALASERIFDALYELDRLLGRSPPEEMAASEDRAWHDDAVDLIDRGEAAVAVGITRSRIAGMRMLDQLEKRLGGALKSGQEP